MFKHTTHRIALLLILLLMSLPDILYAQDATLSKGGRFRVDYVKGCAPLRVKVTEEIDQSNDVRQYWTYSEANGNTTPLVTMSEAEFLFDSPGKYLLIQIMQETDPPTDTIRIEVKEPTPPLFEASNCGNSRVWVQAIRESSRYDFYIINDNPDWELNVSNDYRRSVELESGNQAIAVKGMYRGEGVDNRKCDPEEKLVMVTDNLESATIRQVRASIPDEAITIAYTLQPDAEQVLEFQENGSGDFEEAQAEPLAGNQLSISSLNPAENYYCFRIRTDNHCEETSEYSNIVCTARLTGTEEENSNKITFSTKSQGSPKANLQRDGSLLHSFGQVSTGTYKDEEIICNTSYTYSLELVYGGATSISEGLSIQNEFSGTPAAPQNLVSRWDWEDPSTVIYEFQAIQNARYRAYRGDGTPPKLVNSTETNLLPLPAAGQNTCYRFGYMDACENESALTDAICALYLYNSSAEPDGLILEWNDYTGYADGVRTYVVSKYDAEGNIVRSFPAGLQTSIDLGPQPLKESGNRYSVSAYPNDISINESSSNLYEFRIIMKGYFPNAFTPNGDGHNDFFKAEGKFVEKCRLQIFDRWGAQVYESRDTEEGWDGNLKDQPAPQGTYMYRATIETMDGAQQTHQGTVFLIRR